MTIEERDTARAIQTIARKLREVGKPQEIDWEQRRYEISKDVLASFMSNSDTEVHRGTPHQLAEDAVNYADALITELKKSNDKTE